jgi:short subunit dehydrogenase-like uncharacterized protein
MSRIVVFGATGYTGGLVVDALTSRGVRPILAGRNKQLLQRLAGQFGGLDWATADIADPRSVEALVEAGDVLIATVGPFKRFGRVAADAAVAKGAHYLDSTGEVDFVEDLRDQLHERARQQRSTLVPAFGYDYVPGLLGAALALDRAGEAASEVRVGYLATGSLRNGLSGGTLATSADTLLQPVAIWEGGTPRAVRAASRLHRFTVQGRRKNTYLLSGTEVLFIPESFPTVQTVEVFNGWFPSTSVPVAALSAVAATLAKNRLGQQLVDGFARRAARQTSNSGPDANERARSQTHVVVEVSDQSGHPLQETHITGPSIYTLTGELLAAAAIHLRDANNLPSGVLSPLTAFGSAGLIELCREVGLGEATDRP